MVHDKNYETMVVISSREFRQNQRKYFEKVDEGEQVIVQRGKNKAYAVTAVSNDDLYFNAEMVQRIKKSMKEVEQGKSKRIETAEEISNLLGL